jgi:hypothetical protein
MGVEHRPLKRFVFTGHIKENDLGSVRSALLDDPRDGATFATTGASHYCDMTPKHLLWRKCHGKGLITSRAREVEKK